MWMNAPTILFILALSVVSELYACQQRLFCFRRMLRYDWVSGDQQQIGNNTRIASRFTENNRVLIQAGPPFLEEATSVLL